MTASALLPSSDGTETLGSVERESKPAEEGLETPGVTVRPEQAQGEVLPAPPAWAQGADAETSADHVSVSATCTLAAR